MLRISLQRFAQHDSAISLDVFQSKPSMKSVIFINSQSPRNAAIICRRAGVIQPNPNNQWNF
jgi:hypothetical protein